jgi:hypothetical protein
LISLPFEAQELLEMKANKKLVQQSLVAESGGVILLKDLSNISASSNMSASKNNLDNTVEKLRSKYGACVEIFCDDSKEFKGLFFQDKEMIAVFDAYPEMIFVDAT